MDYATAVSIADDLMQTRHPILQRHRIAEALIIAAGKPHDEVTCRYCIAAAARKRRPLVTA